MGCTPSSWCELHLVVPHRGFGTVVSQLLWGHILWASSTVRCGSLTALRGGVIIGFGYMSLHHPQHPAALLTLSWLCHVMQSPHSSAFP